MNAKKSLICLAPVLAFVLLAGSVWAYTAERKVEKTFTLSKGADVIVRNVNGRISIVGGHGNEVKLVARIKVKSRSRSRAEKAMQHVRVDIDESPDRLVVHTRLPKRSSSFFGLLTGKWTSASVDYELIVPADLGEVTARTVNGGIEVEKVSGTVNLKTTNGGISVDNVSGAVNARTINGGMDIHLSSWDERESMEFSTVNGSIELSVPKDSDFDIDASVTNGHIETDFPVEVYGKISRRHLKGRVGEGGRLIEIHTTNGSVKITTS